MVVLHLANLNNNSPTSGTAMVGNTEPLQQHWLGRLSLLLRGWGKVPCSYIRSPESFHLLKGLMWICTQYTFPEDWKSVCRIVLLSLTGFNPADLRSFLLSFLFAAWTQQSYHAWHFWRFRGAEETRTTNQETPPGILTAGKKPGTSSNCNLLKDGLYKLENTF